MSGAVLPLPPAAERTARRAGSVRIPRGSGVSGDGPRPSPAAGSAVPRGLLARVLVPVALLLVGGALRLADLGHPDRLFFDEVYYAVDATELLRDGVTENRAAHPPVGTWTVALGIRLLGDDPTGWRTASAVAGTAAVLVTYAVGLRLLRRVVPAALAGLLVALDGLAVTSSRIAMLDAVLGLLVVSAAWAVLRDRDARRTAVRVRGAGESLLASAVGSRWRWAAGLVLGLAVATKWSGLLAVGAAGLVVLAVETWGRGEKVSGGARRLLATAAGAALSLVVLPAAVYVAAHVPWMANLEDSYVGDDVCPAPCEAGPVERLDAWADAQVDLLRFHRDLEATHPYRSSPWGWPVQARPVLSYLETCGFDTPPAERGECVVEPGERAQIRMLGNPALWWAALAAYPVLLWRSVRRRDPAAAFVGVWLLALWAPWLLAGRPGYLFYVVPEVPFVALGLAVAVASTAGRLRRVGTALVVLLAVVAAAWFAPVWYGWPLDPDQASLRAWLPGWGG